MAAAAAAFVMPNKSKQSSTPTTNRFIRSTDLRSAVLQVQRVRGSRFDSLRDCAANYKRYLNVLTETRIRLPAHHSFLKTISLALFLIFVVGGVYELNRKHFFLLPTPATIFLPSFLLPSAETTAFSNAEEPID